MAGTRERRVEPSGVVVVDKARGPTSHDVVASVRRAVKSRHVGHAGTLDPMATGVLVVAIGEATKLVPWLTAADKGYEATIRLGTGTSTLDAESEVVETAPVPDELRRFVQLGEPSGLLETALEGERARVLQVPPAFSAIRIDGVRAHTLARAGKLDDVELPARAVEIRSLVALGGGIVDGGIIELHVRVEAAKGFFVRSLARDLASALGTVGHLTALRRTRSGAFTLADAVPLDGIRVDALIPIARAAAQALPVTRLDDAGVRAVSYGQRVAPEQMTDPRPGPSAWLDASSRLVAIGECDEDGSGRVIRGFPPDPTGGG